MVSQRRSRSRGTSLVEMMVVVFVFVSMMAIIMLCYVEAQNANKRQGEISEEYRAAVQATLRVESLLQNARIYTIKSDSVIFAPPLANDQVPTIKHRWPQYRPTATTLWIDNTSGRLMQREGTGPSSVVINLNTGQTLQFGGGGNTVRMIIQGATPNPLAPGRQNYQTFSLTHDIHINNTSTL